MNFGEMQQDIALLTKRPDKLSEIKIAINDAILHYTLAASFAADLVEGNIAINATEFAQNLQISVNFPRFRKLLYLRPPGAKPLAPVDPLKVITDKGCEQLDKWYRSGDYIYFKLRTLSSSLDYGYYSYPARYTQTSDTSWMLDTIPHIIRYRAISEIFDSIGEKDEANKAKTKADEAFIIAKNDLAIGAIY
jgi:hypothetical protein